MRITVSTIRRIIREETRRVLREAPYAGDLGVVRGEDQETDSFITANIAQKGANRPGSAKYPTTRKFRELAEKHFSNIPYGVWLAPLIGHPSDAGVSADPRGPRRGAVVDLVPDGIKRLERLGFKAPARVGGDDLVILYTSMTTDAGVIASPWMIFHSIFDTNSMTAKLMPGYRELVEFLTFGEPEDDELMLFSNLTDNPGPADALVSTLTMASARAGDLGGGSDPLAEMMCQELLTKSGLRLDLDAMKVPKRSSWSGETYDPDELRETIIALGQRVKQMAADFRRNARGKLIITATN